MPTLGSASVSATVQDPSGQIFANGSWQLIFKELPSSPGPFLGFTSADPTLTPFTRLFSGQLDATGSFSGVTVHRNDFINPAGSRWTLIVTPNANGQSYSVDLNINNTVQDVSAAINAVITNVVVQSTTVAHAYKDAEVVPIPGSGGLYFDVTLKVLKIWDVVNQVWLIATASNPAIVPTGTGFFHATAGVEDAAAKLVNLTASSDVAPNQGTINQLLHGNAAGQPSFSGVSLTSDAVPNQGTSTTVLHGNAAGQPTFGAVNLATDVTGTLPLAGQAAPTGTGFDHITAGNRDGAAKLVNLTAATDVAANQGTNVTVLHGNAAGQAAFAVVTPADAAGNTSGSGNFALTTSPVFTTPSLGVASATSLEIAANNPIILDEGTAPAGIAAKDLIYGDATGHRLRVKLNNAGQDTIGLLSDPLSAFGSTTSTQLATVISDETGTGLVVFNNAPALISPSTTGTDSGSETLQNKRLTPRQVSMADATSVTPTSDTADINTFVSSQVAGTLTVNAPSGTPTDGQKLVLRLKSTNAQTYSFNATYAFSTTVTAPTTLAAGKTDYIGLMWNATNTKWDVVAVDQGH